MVVGTGRKRLARSSPSKFTAETQRARRSEWIQVWRQVIVRAVRPTRGAAANQSEIGGLPIATHSTADYTDFTDFHCDTNPAIATRLFCSPANEILKIGEIGSLRIATHQPQVTQISSVPLSCPLRLCGKSVPLRDLWRSRLNVRRVWREAAGTPRSRSKADPGAPG